MRQMWAIDVPAFEAFLHGLALQLRAFSQPTVEKVLAAFKFDAQAITEAANPLDEAMRAGLPVQRDGDTAVVSLTGPMVKGPSWLTFFGFAVTPLVRAALKSAVGAEDIRQIVLRIDSPGGTVQGTHELAKDVAAAAKVKTVIAQSDGMIASAAYWVASQATAIHAGQLDMVGSIGVRMLTYDFSKAFEEAGIRPVAIDTGPFKSVGAPGTEITAEHEAYLQELVDSDFAHFRAAVMAGRSMNDEQFNAVSDGRVFTMTNAIDLRLVDKIQGIDETIARFRKQASDVRKARARVRLSTSTA